MSKNQKSSQLTNWIILIVSIVFVQFLFSKKIRAIYKILVLAYLAGIIHVLYLFGQSNLFPAALFAGYSIGFVLIFFLSAFFSSKRNPTPLKNGESPLPIILKPRELLMVKGRCKLLREKQNRGFGGLSIPLSFGIRAFGGASVPFDSLTSDGEGVLFITTERIIFLSDFKNYEIDRVKINSIQTQFINGLQVLIIGEHNKTRNIGVGFENNEECRRAENAIKCDKNAHLARDLIVLMGIVLIADKKYSEVEHNWLQKQLNTLPEFKGYSAENLISLHKESIEIIKAQDWAEDAKMISSHINEDEQTKNRVYYLAYSAANSDGEITPEEEKILQIIRNSLDISEETESAIRKSNI